MVKTGRAIPVRFLRRVDAEMALHAIKNMADWSLPLEELNELVDKDEVQRTMTRALAW